MFFILLLKKDSCHWNWPCYISDALFINVFQAFFHIHTFFNTSIIYALKMRAVLTEEN